MIRCCLAYGNLDYQVKDYLYDMKKMSLPPMPTHERVFAITEQDYRSFE